MAGSPEVSFTQKDLSLIPLLNLVAEPVSGSVTASSANVGKIYRNTVSSNLEFVLNATTVVHFAISGSIVDADIASGAAIANSKLATNPLARANHTGTQLAATVSDFDAQVNTHHVNDLAAATADLAMNTHKITGLVDGVSAQDAVTLNQVQNLISASANGQDWKASARVASTTNVTVSGPGATIDGVTLTNGDRVLLAGQTTTSQNGLYVFNGAASALTRTTDANTSAMVTSGMTVPIEEGSKDNTYGILTTNNPITLGTTGLAFTFLSVAGSYTGSGSIQVVGSVISIVAGGVSVAEGGTGATTAAAARTSLNVPRRGFSGLIGAITAGSSVDVTHGLALTNAYEAVAQVTRVSDNAVVDIGIVFKDANTVTVYSDIGVTISTLRLAVTPLF